MWELNGSLYLIGGYVVPLLLPPFVPVLNVVPLVLWALFRALGYWRWRWNTLVISWVSVDSTFRGQSRLLRRHWQSTLGFGGITLLLILIPVLNFPVMPAAMIGATLI